MRYIANSKEPILMRDTSRMHLDSLCKFAPLGDLYESITGRKEINDLCNQGTHRVHHPTPQPESGILRIPELIGLGMELNCDSIKEFA